MPIHSSELPTSEALEAFFFEGMCATGWSSPTPEIIPHPNLVGWKQTLYHKPFGDGHALLLTDSWGDGRGSTKITLCLKEGGEILLWLMRYKHNKIFPKSYLKRLTGILHNTYSRNEFRGGRGFMGIGTYEGTHYWNQYEGDFSYFFGREEARIYRGEARGPYDLLGDTDYSGGFFIG